MKRRIQDSMKRKDDIQPPIAGLAGDEKTQLNRDRMRATWSSPIMAKTEQRAIGTSPLFNDGREEQSSLFGDCNA